MKYVALIIPDVHEQVSPLKLILQKHDDVPVRYFLGDFMDTFKGFTEDTDRMVEWIRCNAADPRNKFCFGNHDTHYAFSARELRCSGYDLHKQSLINRKLTDEDHWKHFRLIHWLDTPKKSYLLSHAGIHPSLLHAVKGFDREALRDMEEEALYKVRYEQQVTAWLAAGRGRGGYAKVGGVTWLDWNWEFEPIDGLNQIVGHTTVEQVRSQSDEQSENYNIDTHLKNYVLVDEEGNLTFESTADV